MSRNNRHEAREIRGSILKILEKIYPDEVGDQLIANVLSGLEYTITSAQVNGHLTYLAEKDYIEIREVTSHEFDVSRNVAKLTTKGIDLLEKSIPDDPGVMFIG